MPNMLISPISNDPFKIQLYRPAHVYLDSGNLQMTSFVKERVTQNKTYFRGYGKDPYVYVASKSSDGKLKFGGAAFVAASEEEFDKATKLEGAVVGSLDDAPGGGRIVTFNRPDKTFFHVRYNPGFALVHKLGHLGYVVPDFDNKLAWYTDNFDFVPSNVVYHWDFSNMDVLTFMHLDLGEEHSDHRSFFMQRGKPHIKKMFVHHTSFEVADFDTQLIGHNWLVKKR
ncbi:hypothetical protein N0V88_004505 [Collariella sp. IMI 366227]|nr:hypothetical protein N0V88_004505 [Collariella sp. IMI 366227]